MIHYECLQMGFVRLWQLRSLKEIQAALPSQGQLALYCKLKTWTFHFCFSFYEISKPFMQFPSVLTS